MKAHTVGFWQTPVAQKVVPVAASIALHVGVALLIILTAAAVRDFTIVDNSVTQTIVPDSTIGDVVGLRAPPIVPDMLPPGGEEDGPPQPVWEPVTSDTRTGGPGLNPITEDPFLPPMVRPPTKHPGDPPRIIGPRPQPPTVTIKTTDKTSGGNAYKIVYLCDASGTMMNVFDELRLEMQRSINNLREIQSFNVIFFRDQHVLAYSKGLERATDAAKKRATEWLDPVAPAGQTDPFEAIRQAFALKPDLIFVLTDGFDNVSSYGKVADEFRKLNTDNHTKVNTILIESRTDPELRAVMEKIAKDSGGQAITLKR